MDTWLNERKSELQPRLRDNKSNHLIGILTMLNIYSFLAKKIVIEFEKFVVPRLFFKNKLRNPSCQSKFLLRL